MDYRKEIKELIQILNEQAQQDRQLAETETSTFIRGLNIGYASAYELCVEWLHRILEN